MIPQLLFTASSRCFVGLILVLLLASPGRAWAQTTKTLPGDYANFTVAINDINATFAAGGVVVNVAAGYNETPVAPLPLLTAQGTGGAAGQIIFRKFGAGPNPKITAPGGTSTTVDGIVRLSGADYVTFDGIDLLDPATNNTTSLQMEMGYALFRLGTGATANGCQNNTIKNCVVTLQRPLGASANVTGIYGANSTSSNLSVLAPGALTALAPNSNNTFTNNTLEGGNRGIVLLGIPDASPYTFYDQNNDVGGNTAGAAGFGGAGSGNLIRNINGFAGGTDIVGIGVNYQNNILVRRNTIANALSGTAAVRSLRGIQLGAGAAGNYTVSFNTLTLDNTGASTEIRGIETGGSALAGASVITNSNAFTIAAGSASAVVQCFYVNGSTLASWTADANTWDNTGSTLATTGSAYFANASSSTPTISFTNNTATNISKTGAGGSFYGYYNNGSPSGGTATLTGNTISNITLTGATTFYGIAQTAAGVSQTVAIGAAGAGNGNTISNITGGSASVYGILMDYNASGSTITNNTISTLSSSVASGTGLGLYGLYVGTAASAASNATAVAATGNTISGLTGTGTGIVAGISVNAGPNTVTINQNALSAITSSNASVSTVGIRVNGGTTVTIGQNTISDLSNSNATTGTVYGLQFAGGGTYSVAGNKIYNLFTPATTGSVTGMISTGGTTFNVSNNLIGDLRAPASTGLNSVVGITASANAWNLYYNTIYLAASSSAATFGTSGILFGTNAVDLRNNLVVNKSTTGTSGGNTIALRRSSAGAQATAPATTNLAATTNNNLYFVSPGAVNYVYGEGSATITPTSGNGQTTLAAYKAFIGAARETASVSEDAPFLSTAGTAATFLHISTTTATQVESGGVAITGITTDYDGDTRGTTPDIGADEGPFTPGDLAPPTIAYTALASTASTADRILTATITDASGIATGTNAPLIYYRKSSGSSYFSAPATGISGSNYTFTISSAALGGVAIGDVIQYYVAAQDASPNSNVGTSPAGGSGANPPGGTAPGTPNQYTILNTLVGTYYVMGTATPSTSPDPTREYPTLTAAVTAYNSSALGGAVSFLLFSNSQGTETYPIVINANADASAANTLTIKPAPGVVTTLSGLSASALIQLNGADYVTIDGANTANGSTRNLSLTNTSTANNALVLWLASVSATNGATNNVVKNLNITGGTNAPTTRQVGIGLLGATKTISGQNNDGNALLNNFITKVAYGIDAEAISTAEAYDNLLIADNVIGPATVSTTLGANLGVFLFYAPGAQVLRNTVQNARGIGGNPVGIFLGAGTANALISRNIIRGMVNTTTTGFGAQGIWCNPGAGAANITVSNNAISGIISGGGDDAANTNFAIMGMGFIDGTGYNVYNNSVQMSGDRPDNAFINKVSAAVFVAVDAAGIDLRNNVLSNVQTTSDPDAVGTGTNYAVYAQATAGTPFTQIDYNLYDIRSGAAARTAAVAPQLVGRLAGADYATLPTWKAATAQDGSSLQGNPGFTSASNLAPNPADPNSYGVNGTGVQIASVAQDLNGNTRSTTVAAGAPDLGAYEVTPTAVPNNLTVTGTPALGGTQTFSFNGRVVAAVTYSAAFTSATGTLPTAVTAKYYPGTNPPPPFAAGARYYNAYFTFSATGGSDYAYAPVLTYDPALLGTIATEAAQRVSQQTPSGYGTYLGSVVNSTARTLDANAQLTRFGLLTISDVGAPLPVELTAFMADRQGTNTALAWTTASEKNSRGFEVQVSTDGRAFRTLDFVASTTPGSTSPRRYNYLDREAGKAGLRYYRLRQLDFDGTATFSPVRTVRFETEAALHLTAAPNPFQQRLTLTVELPVDTQAVPAELSLTDAVGRTLLKQTTPALPAGLSPLELPDLSKLASGVYLVHLALPGQLTQHVKVLKE